VVPTCYLRVAIGQPYLPYYLFRQFSGKMYCLATIHVLQMTDGQQTTAVVGQWSVCNCYCVHQIFSVMVQCTRGSWYELLRGWKDTVATSYSAQPASWRCRAHIYGKWSRQNTTCWRRMSSTSSRSWIVASTHAGGVAIDASHVLTNQESDTELLKWCYFTFCFLKDDAYIVVNIIHCAYMCCIWKYNSTQL